MLEEKTLDEVFTPITHDLKKTILLLQDYLQSDNELLKQVINYLINTGGKHIRPGISLLSTKLLKQTSEAIDYKVAAISEMVHIATLLHDDVIDDSDIRRNKKTINAIWGNKKAVIAGDYVISRATALASSMSSIELIDLYSQVLEEICLGEILQSTNLFDSSLSLEDYIEKSSYKTASLFRAATKSTAIINETSIEKKNALNEFGINYGIVFQIVDDILNFMQSDVVGKPSGQDLFNGIITAPVIFAMEEYPEISDSIEDGFDSKETFEEIMTIIKNSQGIKKSKILAQKYIQKAKDSLLIFDDSPSKKSMLYLVESAIHREF